MSYDHLRRWCLGWIFTLSASSKLVFWEGWQNFLDKELSPITPLLKYLLWTGPAFEILIVLALLGKFKPKLTYGSIGLVSLAFAAYHYHALRSNTNAPCACFGPILSTSHSAMLMISLAIAVMSCFSPTFWKNLWAAYIGESQKARLGMHLVALPFLPALLYHVSLVDLAPKHQETLLADSESTAAYLTEATSVYFSKNEALGKALGFDERGLNTFSKEDQHQVRFYALVDVHCTYSQKFLEKLPSLSTDLQYRMRIILHPVLSQGQVGEFDKAKLFSYFGGMHPVLGLGRNGFRSLTLLSDSKVPLIIGAVGSRLYKIDIGDSPNDALSSFFRTHSNR